MVLAVMGGVAWYVMKIKDEVAVPELESQRMLEVLEEAELPDVEPGDRAFQKAVELLVTGRLEEAKEKLQFIVNFSPGSGAARESRRILGEIHLDELFADPEKKWRKFHVVESGDAPLALAKKYETTLDCLMAINGLNRLRIHPGDELEMLPLNFNVRIDLKRRALILRRTVSEEPRRDEFVKEYHVIRYRIPDPRKDLVLRRVRDKSGWDGRRAVSTTNESYRGAEKVIWLTEEGWQIRGMPEDGNELPSVEGFFLERPDMEELALLLRVGNEVEVLTNRKSG